MGVGATTVLAAFAIRRQQGSGFGIVGAVNRTQHGIAGAVGAQINLGGVSDAAGAHTHGSGLVETHTGDVAVIIAGNVDTLQNAAMQVRQQQGGTVTVPE